jgi:disulfide bond formation protein DsbB
MIAFDPRTASPRDPQSWLVAIAAVSALALVVALALQYLLSLPPCPLCVWQRWPYLLAVALTVGGVLMEVPRTALVLVLLVLLGGVGLAAYHVGVEEGVFALPGTCAAAGKASTVEELRRLLEDAPPRCDEVTASLLGLSLAGWNLALGLLLSGAALLGLWVARIRS